MDGNATDVGDLTLGRYGTGGQSSTTHGYVSGGTPSTAPTIYNTIDKFPFASDGNASDVGDLASIAHILSTGQSSTTSGYTSGGRYGSADNVIEKFPFSTDSNSTDVGDLTQGRYWLAGQQV
jgi:hypothetical protein